MKEEIETKHFEYGSGDIPHQIGRGVYVSPQPVSHGFLCVMSVKFLFSPFFFSF